MERDLLEILRWGRNKDKERKSYGENLPKKRWFPEIRTREQQKAFMVRLPSGYHWNVIVSVSFAKFNPGSLSQKSKDKLVANTEDAVKYLLRFEGEGFDEKGKVSLDKALETFKEDAVFKLVISPERSEVLTEDYIRSIVSFMEKNLDRKLVWTAAFHENTAHPHCHVIISRTQGEGLSWEKPLRMDKKLISRGIRGESINLMEKLLGKKSQDQYRSDFIKAVDKYGLGRLDHLIAGNPKTGTGLLIFEEGGRCIVSQSKLNKIPDWQQKLVEKRLEFLSSTMKVGFVREKNRWICYDPQFWKTKLMEKEKLSPFAGYGEIEVLGSGKPFSETIEGEVLKSVEVDDNRGRVGLLVRDSRTSELKYVETELPYEDSVSIDGKEVTISPKKAKTSGYRTPEVHVKRGR